jgi:hypothetical protein
MPTPNLPRGTPSTFKKFVPIEPPPEVPTRAKGITVVGPGARYRVLDCLSAAGVRVVVHGPTEFSLRRADVPRALAALREAHALTTEII